MESKAAIKRKHILKSAKEFILKNGFNALTLDSVAKQAGISKGGLLYHFPNKEALLIGLAQYIFEEFTIRLEEHAKKDPIEKGKWCRAFIEASKWDLEHNAELNVGIIAASMLNPDLLENISQSCDYIQNKVEQDNINPVTATIIRLAIDGLYYSELFNIAPLDDKLREKVIQQLINMTK
ncbi:TetR/AcrR family transcriptional regulator [Parageobacillus thermoglucosidasius]|uniref:TetR family transcriptional regulator n=1 Tax=Parageobacillus thermoglucosidasius TaxID=1426 RepID=A0AB38QZW1_PARTM|nr:TetR/AcrR family transcriptional regulator [Parageobacillus thermoglucosidasius]UOE76874.1 TetR family transcriptional regulator [Parageobacillus thermoglucosidasius]GCD83988.1 TetR family transcriptional regulator [Parageobacillus thermoglucosidasius]